MRTLKQGSKGQDVEVLQLALSRAGYNSGYFDGIFGTRTNNALVKFQKDNGLSPDGVAGMLTWARLKPYLTGYLVHTVARGETFWLLAERYNTSVNAIRVANPQVNPLSVPLGIRIAIPLGFSVVATDISYSHELTMFQIEGLAIRYPFIRTTGIGTSMMGKDIMSLKMGNGRRQICYNASHHANEWITTPVLLKYAEDLAHAYAFGEFIYGINAKELFHKATLYLVPLVNPDGVDLVTGALTSDNKYYKQAKAIASGYPQVAFPDGWKANISGTDLNLNYPANWELAKETKYALGITSPAPRDFVGAEPLSATESRAMYDFTNEHNFALTLSYHTQGRTIFWKYLDYEPENSYEIGQVFAESSGYTLALTPTQSSYAGYKDWFIQTYNRPGYTIEAGLGENPLPITQFSSIYNNNIGILTLGMQLA